MKQKTEDGAVFKSGKAEDLSQESVATRGAEGGNPLTYLARMTWRFKASKKRVLTFLLLFFLAGTMDILAIPYAWSLIFDCIQTKGVTSSSLIELTKLLAFLVATIVAFWMLHGPARVLERDNAFKARVNHVGFLMKGVLGLPVQWHSDHQTGNTIDRVNKGSDSLYNFSKDSYRIVYELIKLTGSASMLIWFYPPSAIVMLVLMGGCVIFVMKVDRKLISQYKEIIRLQNSTSAAIYDCLSNIMTVIILRAEKPILDSVMRRAEKPVRLNFENNVLNEIKWFIVGLACNLMTVFVLGGYLYHQASLSVGVSAGSVFLLYRYLDKVGGVFSNFAGMYGDIVQNRTGVMNAEELSSDFISEKQVSHVLPANWKEISIKDLRFSYESDTCGKKHLDDVSLTVKRGQRVAFVGRSGCGKSTMLKVMRGLYNPASLSLSVDGVTVESGFDGIARGVSLIPQSPEIFSGSVIDNITLGIGSSSGKVEACLEASMFESVVSQLPRGLDTLINEKGVNLSGGQMQRLALSRGLHESEGNSILLLDEPTSSLDGVTEREIYRRIFDRFRDAAIISAIHRLHLLPMFDTVCFFVDGKIIASGSFDELRSSCPEFGEMFEAYSRSGDESVGEHAD